MNYKEYKELNFAGIAAEILEFWNKEKIFEKSITNREGAESYTFYEGPPSANGTPGIHHVMARTVKDIFCRYKTLQGYQVNRKGGWDTHGLPVELQVEKQLGITKEDIGTKISIEEYNRKCRETVMMYKDHWDDLTRKMGYWVDLNDPYITYKQDYIESIWWLLRQLYDKQLLYKGYTIQPYSPAAGTGLSSHELNLPGCYKMVKDTSIVAQFKVKQTPASAFLFENGAQEPHIIAWTTTPWTLPSNTALTVGEKITYVQINTFNPYTFKPVSVVMAKDLVGKYFSDKTKDGDLAAYKPGDKAIPWHILQEFPGKQMLGITYEQLMPYMQPFENADKAFHVIAGDFVTTEDGTGIVHTSPTFGADDFRVAQQNGIPALTFKDEADNELPIVDKRGKFVAQIGSQLAEGVAKYQIKTHKPLGPNDFYVKNYTQEDETNPDYKSTDVIISIILKEENKAFKVEKYEHTYPHCWRTDKPVLYYPLDSWFIKTTACKDRMVALNETINWKPEATGTGRFGHWLKNLVDWNLSRSRYWGTPLPIWRTEDSKQECCIGSMAELTEKMQAALSSGKLTEAEAAPMKIILESYTQGNTDIDLHRPYVDQIILLSADGEKMYREPDLIDVWFDSGAMPYAQWHYPFENTELFKRNYPADFIAEGVDQTRGWFFTLHAIAVMLFDSVAFKNVVSNGLVLDKNGNKMSKRLGNAVDPFAALDKYGADVVRWYMIENAPPWVDLKFNEDGILEAQRRFFGTLLNTYSFFALYANIDGFIRDDAHQVAPDKLTYLDRWVMSRLQTLITEVTQAFDDYEPTRAVRAIQDFVNDHLSNWYVRLNRKRFWKPTADTTDANDILSDDKKAAYQTLHECILVVSQLMAPVAPFFAEWLYKNLTDNVQGTGEVVSVHLSNLAKPNQSLVDASLEQSMDYAQRICSLVHSIRKSAKIKVRTPLQKILLPVLNDSYAAQIKSVEEIILSEVNVKTIEYIDDASGLLIKQAKPNFAKLGKKYGKQVKEVAAVINSFGKQDITDLEKDGKLAKGGFDLELEDVLISSQDIPGWSVASDGNVTVALDITITEELKKEGIARDFVNRVQNLRKDLGLEVLDKIRIDVQQDAQATSPIAIALASYSDYIRTETQALALELNQQVSDGADVELDEFIVKVKISVQK